MDEKMRKLSSRGSSPVDSGYSSADSETIQQVLEGVCKREQRVFLTFTAALRDVEFDPMLSYLEKHEKLMRILDDYYRANLSEEEDNIKEELYFKRLDLAIREGLTRTKLNGNEGSAFLSVVRSSADVELLCKLIGTIGVEKASQPIDLIKKYIDVDGDNILHVLAGNIRRKYETGCPLCSEDWEAYRYFAQLVPDLQKSKNNLGRMPAEVITEQTELDVPSPGDDADQLHQGVYYISPSSFRAEK